jgi:hypothetical protein
MKMKNPAIALLALSALGAVMIMPIHGATNFAYSVSAWTDKSSYAPGDSGTLYITIRNTGTQSFTVRNVSIDWPWMAFITNHWDGNLTSLNINQAVGTPTGTWNTQYSFTIPTDGRAFQGSDATIFIGTDITTGPQAGIYQTGATIRTAIPTYQPLDLSTSILPIINIVLIGAAVVVLVFVYMGIRKQSKK